MLQSHNCTACIIQHMYNSEIAAGKNSRFQLYNMLMYTSTELDVYNQVWELEQTHGQRLMMHTLIPYFCAVTSVLFWRELSSLALI